MTHAQLNGTPTCRIPTHVGRLIAAVDFRLDSRNGGSGDSELKPPTYWQKYQPPLAA